MVKLNVKNSTSAELNFMRLIRLTIFFLLLALSAVSFIGIRLNPHSALAAAQKSSTAGIFDVRAFGAKGDGKALDSPAINKAIDAAAAAGGGTVRFSAGTYRSFSIRLKRNVSFSLDQGSTILAADPKDGDGKYDDP